MSSILSELQASLGTARLYLKVKSLKKKKSNLIAPPKDRQTDRQTEH